MKLFTFSKRAACALLLGTALVTVPAAPAHAATEHFLVTSPFSDLGDASHTEGDIDWSNRTARITGWVYDNWPNTSTVAVFEAFVGTTKTGSETRSVNDETTTYPYKEFNFTIGNPNVSGDLTRIKISTCHYWDTVSKSCKTITYDK